MTLKAAPPWMEPTVTTTESSGEISRDTIVWSASTMRRRAVAARARNLDRELVDGCHQGAAVDADLSDGHLVPEVQAERRPDAVEDAVARAGLRTSRPFLGGLEEQAERARVFRRRQARGEAEGDRDMAVMPARVHPPGLFGGVGRPGLLLER